MLRIFSYFPQYNCGIELFCGDARRSLVDAEHRSSIIQASLIFPPRGQQFLSQQKIGRLGAAFAVDSKIEPGLN